MALSTNFTGRVTKIAAHAIITTPFSATFTPLTWAQTNIATIVAELALPATWTVTLQTVEILHEETTNGVTTYTLRVNLALT